MKPIKWIMQALDKVTMAQCWSKIPFNNSLVITTCALRHHVPSFGVEPTCSKRLRERCSYRIQEISFKIILKNLYAAYQVAHKAKQDMSWPSIKGLEDNRQSLAQRLCKPFQWGKGAQRLLSPCIKGLYACTSPCIVAVGLQTAGGQGG